MAKNALQSHQYGLCDPSDRGRDLLCAELQIHAFLYHRALEAEGNRRDSCGTPADVLRRESLLLVQDPAPSSTPKFPL